VAGDWPANLPFTEFSAQRWSALHQRTFWNPYVFAGIPSAASLADARPQYLPDVLLDALRVFDRLPVWPILVLPLLAHLVGMLAEVAHDDPDSTLGWCDDQTEFEFGLDVILDGLDRKRQEA